MPRYYFNSRDERVRFDDEGVELPDDEAACREAVRVAGEMLAARNCEIGETDTPSTLWVTDQPDRAGYVVVTVEVSVQTHIRRPSSKPLTYSSADPT
jgi:hypothetical protein